MKTTFYSVRSVHDWKQISNLYDTFERSQSQWVFRGASEWSWGLQTTLERTLSRLAPPGTDALIVEGGLLRRFKRQAHHYLSELPDGGNWLQWLALMQHHGAPTRLLDWSYSFYVALHFAVESFSKESTLWALDSDWLKERAKDVYGDRWNILENDWNVSKAETFATLFGKTGKDTVKCVTPVNPYQLSERLAIQQGLFLCQSDLSASFEENLASMCGKTDARGRILKIRIRLKADSQRDILRRLFRMNLTRTSLFPGLDGFAQSLPWLILFPNVLVPDINWPKRRPNLRVQPTTSPAMRRRRG